MTGKRNTWSPFGSCLGKTTIALKDVIRPTGETRKWRVQQIICCITVKFPEFGVCGFVRESPCSQEILDMQG